jgi:hypothetical protein
VEKQLILRIKKMGDDHTLRLGEGLQSLAVLQEALF